LTWSAQECGCWAAQTVTANLPEATSRRKSSKGDFMLDSAKTWLVTSIVSILLACATVGTATAATAYPAKPIRMVVPFAPGGSTDLVGRMIAQKLADLLGQSVFVDNRAGGATNIGAEFAARSAPDGYTLFMASSTQVINASLFPKLNYDLARDFAAISIIASSPAMLVVSPNVSARSVKELVALIRAQPGKLAFASGGTGSTGHLAGELFRISDPAINVIHVPYKGSGPAMIDLLSGQVQYLFGFTDVLPFVKSGKLRALAVTSAKRLEDFPDLPSMQESGLKDFEVSVWFGLLAPAGTPAEIVDQLNAQTAKAVDELTPRLRALSAYPLRSSPAQFATFIKQDIARWAPAVQRSGAKPE